MDIFYGAFIQKNHLYSKPSDNDNEEPKEFTPEEEKKLRKMMQLMEGIERHIFTKQIENK